jgi:serine/threonine protein phosphatase PrpC
MIKRACCSDPGKLRVHNEDACAFPPPGADETRLGSLLALADGTGGLPGGGEASREAVQYVQALYYAAPTPDNLPDRLPDRLPDLLRQSVAQVNALNRLAQRQLAQRQPAAEQGHLTTLVAALIHADQIWVANVGDSRAYLAKAVDRQLVQLTEDHSGHVRNVKVGLVSAADLASRESGIITRAIGLQDDCQVDIYHYTWSPGDRLVLCSDGLSHLAPEEMISIVLDDLPEEAARVLVARAVETDGSDNCTAVVAAWLLSDLPENHPVTPAPRLKLRPGTRLVLFGVLLGLLVILLGLNQILSN